MANGMRIEKLTRQGIALMQEERELAIKGDIPGLDKLNERKAAFLTEMDKLAAGKIRVSAEQRAELETLFDIIRRRAEENQALLQAAVAGVQSAQRRLSAMNSQQFDIGAYGRNGMPIKNNNDITNNSHLA